MKRQDLDKGRQICSDVMSTPSQCAREVCADGAPDLNADRVWRGAIEGAKAQVLFDPAEEQFDRPAALVVRSSAGRCSAGGYSAGRAAASLR